MTPRYLADQLDRSRRNLGVDCIDVFYLHNPETQFDEVPAEEFESRIRGCFPVSRIRRGGAQNWRLWARYLERVSREPEVSGISFAGSDGEIAAEVGRQGPSLPIRAIAANLAMPEALTLPNQVVAGKTMAMVQAGRASALPWFPARRCFRDNSPRIYRHLCAMPLGNGERFRTCAAIRPIRPRDYDGTRRDEPDRARAGESGSGGRRTCREMNF